VTRTSRATALLAVLCSLGSQVASACTCQDVDDPVMAMRISDWVLRVRVSSSRETMLGDRAARVLTLDVEEVWKGAALDKGIVVLRGTCTPPISVGEEYYLFAYRDGLFPNLSLCMPSTLVATAPPSFSALGPGHPPFPAVLFIAICFVPLLAFGIWAWRRMRRHRSRST
jgi:hypothetical protein